VHIKGRACGKMVVSFQIEACFNANMLDIVFKVLLQTNLTDFPEGSPF
jgi:hypothetical protein